MGPVPCPKADASAQDLKTEEAQFAPQEGETRGQLAWKKVTLDTTWLDFGRLLGKHPDSAAFAFTRIYAPVAETLRMNLTFVGEVRAAVNGKASSQMGVRFKLDLQKGWNRLLLKVTPGETANGTEWIVAPVLHGWGNSTYRTRNIAWRTPLPGAWPGFYGGGMGVASPLIVGDRLYVTTEPSDLVCLNKTDGRVLWLRRSSYYEAADEQQRARPAYKEAAKVADKIDALNAAFVAGKATAEQLQDKGQLEKDLHKKMKRVDAEKYAIETAPDIGYSGFTPASDGRFIYTWYGNGVSACYDLDGNRRWIRTDRFPAVEHGFSSSPLLVDEKFVVFMRDLLALDAVTGRLAWQVPVADHEGLNPAGFFHGSPTATSIGGVRIIVLPNGTLLRAGDGKVLYECRAIGMPSVASPVVEGDTILQVSSSMKLFLHRLPAKLAEPLRLEPRIVDVDTPKFLKHYMPWYLASPVVHEGLAYLLNNAGVLTVVDVAAGRVVYQKLLDLDALQAHNEGPSRGIGVSPALAGKHLYFWGNNGAALVIEPGRVYRQFAKNKIENVVLVGHWSERQERFVANPVFEGKRLYLRGEDGLYAIGPL
jgi:outer membrane protein assembly factor BamB